MDEDVLILFVVVVFVAGGVALMIASMNNRRRIREMEHRERIAMIQAGVVPSPESDPAGFESAAGISSRRGSPRGERYRTAGVGLIGFGLGLIVLIGGAFENPEVGFGVGGAWVMLGAALLVNYFLIRNEVSREPAQPAWKPGRPSDREPPSNVAP